MTENTSAVSSPRNFDLWPQEDGFLYSHPSAERQPKKFFTKLRVQTIGMNNSSKWESLPFATITAIQSVWTILIDCVCINLIASYLWKTKLVPRLFLLCLPCMVWSSVAVGHVTTQHLGGKKSVGWEGWQCVLIVALVKYLEQSLKTIHFIRVRCGSLPMKKCYSLLLPSSKHRRQSFTKKFGSRMEL